MTLGKFQHRHDDHSTLPRMWSLSTIRNVPSVSFCSFHGFDISRSRTSEASSRRRDIRWMNCGASFQQIVLGKRRSGQISPLQSFPLQQLPEGLVSSRSRRVPQAFRFCVRSLDQLQDRGHCTSLNTKGGLDFQAGFNLDFHSVNGCNEFHQRPSRRKLSRQAELYATRPDGSLHHATSGEGA